MLRLSPNRRTFALWLLLVLAIVASSIPGYDQIGQRMDDGALLLYPELILKGWLPYRDFETFYGPANTYLLAGVYALFQPGILVERTVGLLYHLAVLTAIFWIVRPRGIVLAFGSVLIAHLFLLPTGLAPFPWLGALSCVLWSLFLVARGPGAGRNFGGGILAAVALLYRPDLAPAVILSAALLLVFQPAKSRWTYLGGFVAGLLPLLWLIPAAGYENVFTNVFFYPVVITNPARKLPWSSLSGSLIYLLVLHFAASITSLFAGFLALRRDSALWTNRLFAAAALLALGTSYQALQRMDSGHITLCCFLSLALFPVSLAILSKNWLASPRRQLLLVGLTLALVGALAPRLIRQAFGLGKKEAVFLEHNGRSFPVDSISTAHETGTLLDKINKVASPGQRLFVGPADLRRTNYNDTFIYHLLPQLTPASYFLEMNPLSANRPGSRLANDIRSADWLILDHRLDEWNEPNESMRFGPNDPNEVVQSSFELFARHGSYDLYRRK
jgi:hypothetical protein